MSAIEANPDSDRLSTRRKRGTAAGRFAEIKDDASSIEASASAFPVRRWLSPSVEAAPSPPAALDPQGAGPIMPGLKSNGTRYAQSHRLMRQLCETARGKSNCVAATIW